MGKARPLKLRYTPAALAELAQVLSDISEHSRQGARHVQARIQTITNLLADYPHSGSLTNLRNMRRIVATPYPYLIFYEVIADELVVIGVRHGSRDPSSMPDQL